MPLNQPGNLDEHRLRRASAVGLERLNQNKGTGTCFVGHVQRDRTHRLDTNARIYALPNDVCLRANAQRIMMEDISAREDDETRLRARPRIASMVAA